MKKILPILSLWLLGTQFLQAQYCTATYGTQCTNYNMYINNFSTTGGSSNITNNNSNCASGSTSYGNYTNMVHATTTTGTISYSVTIGSSYSQGVMIWVDWNGDGDFYDSGETVANTGVLGAGGTATGSFSVPSGTACGPKRMRVRSSYYTSGFDPCGSQSYGETEDYTVSIMSATACSGTPSSSNATATSTSVCATVPFGLGLSANYCLSGTTFQWQSSANNSTWSNISGATQQTHSTSQTSSTYYRCVISCGSNSINSSSVHVQMAAATNCYCSATSTYGTSSGAYMYIQNVTFNTLNHTTSALASPYWTVYPATGNQTTTVLANNTYTLSTTVGYYGACGAWIDWNQNGAFETTEYYFMGSNSNTSGTITYNNSVTVPSTALPGQTRIRVRTEYYYYGMNSTMSCGTTNYGETKDYTITILPLVGNDAGIQEIINPSTPTCDFDSVDVTVSLNNWGANVLTSCLVKYQINNGTVNTYNYTGSVPTFGSGFDTIVLGMVNFSSSDLLEVWTESPNNATDSISINDSAGITTIAGLSGTYSIPNDFATLNAAATALAAVGVCGDVVFELASGTYTEQVTFTQTLGTGPDATVTFTSATGDYSDVIIQHSSSSQTNNHVIYLNGADWYIFDELTLKNTGTSIYGNIVNLANSAHNNTIQNCWLKSVSAGTTGTGNYQSAVYINGNNNNTKILNNRIEKGNTPIYAYGAGTGVNSIQGLTIEGNRIEDMQYYGPFLYYIADLEYNGNTVTSDSASTYGVVYYGNYIYYVERFNVTNNYFVFDVTPNAYNVLFVNCIGASSPRSQFSNNCIIQGNANSTSYSYYNVQMSGSGNMDMFNNTMNRKGQTSTSYRNLQLSGGGNTNIMNNSFSDMSGGYAMYVSGTWTLSGSDHNNFYSTGATPIYYGVSNYSTLAAYQAASGYDANSVRTNPAFQNITECITCNDTLNNAAAPLSSIQTDVAGNSRSVTTPDIGASEYVTPATFTLGPDDTICGNTAIVEAGPAQSITWNVNSQAFSTPSITLTANNQPITYNIQVNITTEYCGSASDAAVIRLVPNANLDTAANICADGDITLTPGGGNSATYSWSTGDNTSTILVNSPGIYTVTKMEEGCESSASIVVTQSDAVAISDVDVCIDDLPVTLDATINDGTSYAWSGGTSVNTAVNVFNVGGTYSVTATDALGCTSDADFNITVLETPTASIAENHWGTNYQFDASGSLFISANTTYFWDFGNGQTANTQVANVIYPWNGECDSTYIVTLTVNNGCGEDVSNKSITPCPLGVNEVVDGAFSIYPNPATESATISFANTFSNGMITLMDISGRTVSSQVVVGGNTSINIDLTNIASGSYIVKLDADGTSSFQQIVVE